MRFYGRRPSSALGWKQGQIWRNPPGSVAIRQIADHRASPEVHENKKIHEENGDNADIERFTKWLAANEDLVEQYGGDDESSETEDSGENSSEEETDEGQEQEPPFEDLDGWNMNRNNFWGDREKKDPSIEGRRSLMVLLFLLFIFFVIVAITVALLFLFLGTFFG
ncbi:unnamed protein product [Cyclocybe aegerita]|uniref:Uncharacterized protein n=1 Tax=Cyclocybe aegerita TaxID=1973307 RepID=A0A8S0X1L8_CYCAE|nr:unnamed protein product [Cyclocybe aegerita]